MLDAYNKNSNVDYMDNVSYMKKPILSICIPTYNRAELLRSALMSLVPQVEKLSNKVELIVSDNCSTDHTQEVVEWARQFGPISYYRNSENLGAARNIMLLTKTLSTGEYGWIIPDDDLARPNAVQYVLKVLQRHSNVDYVFVNVSTKLPQDRHALGKLVTGADFPKLLPTKGKSLEDRYIKEWDELIDPDVDSVFLGSLMCGIFRLSLWNMYQIEWSENTEPFSSLFLTYPHSIVLAHTMVGQPAYYIGYPCIVTFYGGQEWLEFIPMIVLVRLQELLDLYKSLGVNKQRIEKCRLYLLNCSVGCLNKLLFNKTIPGREYFSLTKFIWQNRYHTSQVIKHITRAIRTMVRGKISNTIRKSPILCKIVQQIRHRREVVN